jgi:hypothetical protein
MKEMQVASKSSRLPERLIGVEPAARRLKRNPYFVLKALVTGELNGELVDGDPKIIIESIERLERQRAETAA